MNKAMIVGRLTRDPDIRQSQGENQTVVARYTLAVDRRFSRNNSEQSADFISMVSFGKTAEFIEKYVRKGTKLVVRGRIQTGSYTNRDGQKVYTTDVVGEDVEFAESKKASEGADGGASYSEPRGDAGSSYSGGADDGFINVPDGINEELPFA